MGRIMVSLVNGTHPSSIRTDRAPSTGAARERQPVQSPGAQRHPVRRRAWLQVARVAGTLRQLAHHPHPDEPLVEERCARPGLRAPATRADRTCQAGGSLARQHQHQGPSRRDGSVKKNGPQAIGESRGGWTTKLHIVAADARTAVDFSLSPGQAHDGPEGRKLLKQMDRPDTPRALMMDRAYEGDKTREQAVALGYEPVVLPKRNRVDLWE